MGLLKVSSFRTNRSMQSYPRLYRIVIHNIYAMHRYLKYQETLQASLSIQNLDFTVFSSPPHIDKPL